MPEWVPFLGLTAVVLTLLLALARASQGVTDSGDAPRGDGRSTFAPEPTEQDEQSRHGAAAPVIESHALSEGWPGYESVEGSPGHESAGAGVARSPELTTKMLLANVALTQGLFGGVLVTGAFFADIPARAFGVTGDPWVGGFPAVALGVGFGLALWGANEVAASLADAVGGSYDEALRELLAPDTRRGWIVLLGGVLPVIAFVEEFIFRAAVVGVPAAGFGVSPWALAVVSSSAFAVGHGAQGRVGVAVTGGLGFVLATGYIVSGSLLVVVVAHYLVNALEFLVHEWLGLERLG